MEGEDDGGGHGRGRRVLFIYLFFFGKIIKMILNHWIFKKMKCVNIQKSGIGDWINQHNFFFSFLVDMSRNHNIDHHNAPNRINNCIYYYVRSFYLPFKKRTYFLSNYS